MTAGGQSVPLRDDPDNDRYVGEIDGVVIASCFYRVRGSVWVFTHTEVDHMHSGQGIGTAVARFALDDVRRRGGTLVPICPFVAAFIRRHPEYEDLIDHEVWDRIRASSAAKKGSEGQ